jgi:hypothetical protein
MRRQDHNLTYRLLLPDPHERQDSRDKPIDIAVVYTDVDSTLLALDKATSFSAGLNARIRLLVSRAGTSTDVENRRFLAAACAQVIDAPVEVHLHDDVEALLMDRPLPRSVVIIGAQRSWLPT